MLFDYAIRLQNYCILWEIIINIFFLLVNHLVHVLRAFYNNHEEYRNSPLYIFGQGHGAQLAVSLAIQLTDEASTLSLLFLLLNKSLPTETNKSIHPKTYHTRVWLIN